MANDPFGTEKQRIRLSEATKQAIRNLSKAHKLALMAEQVAADAQVKRENERIIHTTLATVNLDLLNVMRLMEIEEARSAEFVESIIDLYLTSLNIKSEFEKFNKTFEASVSLTLALMSVSYIMAMVLQSEETVDRTLNQIGEKRVEDWLRRHKAAK